MNDVAAIIPAAGLSSRMGRFKPLLPLGGGTVLSSCIDVFKANGIERILVVTGKRADEVSEAAERSGAVTVYNESYEQGMFSSVLKGLGALDGVSAFFMLPVDIPLLRRETVARLLQEFKRCSPTILYPCFLGERGHPPIISRTLLPDIFAHDGAGGLRTVLDRHEPGARDLNVADFGVGHDLDCPADYELALSRAGTGYPCEEECRQLWEMYSLPFDIIRHCQAVSCVAEALADNLNTRGGKSMLDPALVRGAALTHDIGKGSRRHEAEGAEYLHTHGFHVAADIVLEHSDLVLESDAPITEKEVVFLADKLVQGERPSQLESRYMAKMDLYGHEPDAKQAILGRLARAQVVLARFDREMTVPAEKLAREVLE
ncbi:DVU_1551 family NTP transferase [uncultured Pseudodesulfovibrio sp.]|uniref:DVU_1551 family NTP transferase n=1 Tax=uncultured Pseudodesulfovibrio sp. TaxID=2035858 RepID=UPI0029C862B6|nr:NTP transferase domain-containing protein [uncultured Pseudodesulfovibrio sp.]